MDENITAKNISRRFSGIQHSILGWNDKKLDDDLFVYVFPINYESCTLCGVVRSEILLKLKAVFA